MTDNLNGGRKKYISYVLRFGIAGGALYLAFRNEDLGKLWQVLLGLNTWVFVAAIGFYVLSQLIFVLRWRLLLKVQAITIGLSPALKLHFLGLFYNNFLPSSVGGDLLRAWYVTKHTDKRLEAALSVFVDRAVGLAGLFIMAAFSYWFIRAEGDGSRAELNYSFDVGNALVRYRWVFLGTAGVIAAVFIAFLLTSKGKKLLGTAYSFSYSRGLRILKRVKDAIHLYCRAPLMIFIALLLTFACQSVFIVGLWLAGIGLGVGASVKYYFVFFPISWLLGTLPISVGGLGIMEGGLKVMFTQMAGVSGEQALALAVCQRLIWLIGSLPGVAIHLAGAHLPKEFFVDYEKPVN